MPRPHGFLFWFWVMESPQLSTKRPQQSFAPRRQDQPKTIDQIDGWFRRLASLSQVGLLALAVFGYVHTVIPAYQRSLLDQQIAQKTAELNQKDGEIRGKVAEMAAAAKSAGEVAHHLELLQQEEKRVSDLAEKQYVELRARVMGEFSMLAERSCQIDKIPDGSFTNCVQKNVLNGPNFQLLKSLDRNTLLNVVLGSKAEIAAVWDERKKLIETRKAIGLNEKNGAEAKCAAERQRPDYADKMTALTIDRECADDKTRINTALMKGDIEASAIVSTAMQEIMEKIFGHFFAAVK